MNKHLELCTTNSIQTRIYLLFLLVFNAFFRSATEYLVKTSSALMSANTHVPQQAWRVKQRSKKHYIIETISVLQNFEEDDDDVKQILDAREK